MYSMSFIMINIDWNGFIELYMIARERETDKCHQNCHQNQLVTLQKIARIFFTF